MAALPPPVGPVAFHRLRPDNSCRLVIGDRTIDVPDHPTKDWLAYLGDQALHRLFPGLIAASDEYWLHIQLSDPDIAFDVPELRAVTHAVIAEITGLPWYVAVRLANLAGTAWFVLDAVTLMRGVDILALPVRRALAVVYMLQREGAKDDDERALHDRELWALPDGEQPSWTPEQQSSSFAAFRAAVGARARAGGA